MDFTFTKEQQAFCHVLRDFASKELMPDYAKWDREKRLPYEKWRKLGDLGITGLRVKEEYGGSEADCLTSGLAAEEIAKADFNLAYAVILNGLIGEILQQHASETIKQSWLKPLAEGKLLLGIAITEPGAGSDAGAIQMKAEKDGSQYVLTGEKSGISLAKAAHGFLVFTKTQPDSGNGGVSAFIVPRDADGIEIRGYDDMGNIPIGRGSVFFDHVRIPLENLIGKENRGFHQLMNGFDFSRALIGLQCIGAAQKTLDETIEHVKQRTAFGHPLAKYEGVSFPIAEYHTKLEMARWLCYRTLWQRDRGLPHTKEASMCKWIGPKVSVETIHECMLLSGHYGYTKEMPIEQRMRDVIGLEIGDGTAQMQKIVIARELLGKVSRPY